MHDAGMKLKSVGYRYHYVILCDETGIFDAFNFIIRWLSAGLGTEFISLIYTVSEKNQQPLFEQELSIIEKRLCYNLVVHISRIDTTQHCFRQELLEATINSNTLPVMKFSIFGNAEFVHQVTQVLSFLDVKGFTVKTQVI